MTTLGQAYVQIIPSAQGISGSISNILNGEAGSAGNSAGSLLGSNLVGTITKMVAAAGIGKLIKDGIAASLSAGADLQQSVGGIETLFKDSADKVKQYAQEAYKTSGVSANAYMENVTSFSASLISSLGGDTKAAADLANTAMTDMSDNANKMGTDIDSIQQTYQSLARGNYAMLDNLKLGYGGTKSEMERLMKDAEKLTGEHYTVGDFADTVKAIHAVQDSLGITGTTAKEAATTFSGSLASMKAAFTDVLGNLSSGEFDIGPSLNALAETTSTFFFGNFIPMVGRIITTLPGAIATFVQAALPLIMEQGGQLLQGLVKGLNLNLPMLDQSGSSILDQISKAIAVSLAQLANTGATIIISLMEWITANLPNLLNTGVEVLTTISNGIFQALPNLITIAGQLITSFVEFLMVNIPVLLQAGADLLLNLVNGIVLNLPAMVTAATQAYQNFVETIQQNLPNFLQKGVEIVLSLVQGIIDNLPAIGESAIRLIGNFIDIWVNNYPQIVQTGWNALLQLVRGILDKLPELTVAAVRLMSEFLAMILSKLPKILSAGGRILLTLASGILQLIGEIIGAAAKVGNALIREITGIDLFAAGRAIMDGFLDGLKSMWNSITSFVGNIADWIESHKGPISYDRKLLIPAGKAIMKGLNKGLVDGFKTIKSTVSGMAGSISSIFGDDQLDYNVSATSSLQDAAGTLSVSALPANTSQQNQNNISDRLASIVTLLDALLAKDADVYLDGEKIALNSYMHQGDIMEREGI